MSHLEVLAAVQRLDRRGRQLFSCSLAQRHLFLLVRYAEAHGFTTEADLAMRLMEECWDGAGLGLEAPTVAQEDFAALWPWWEGLGAWLARNAQKILNDAAQAVFSAEGRSSVQGVAATASISHHLRRLAGPPHPAPPDAVPDDEVQQFEDLSALRATDAPGEVLLRLRHRSVAIARARARWADAIHLGAEDRLAEPYKELPRLETDDVDTALAGLEDITWRHLQHAYGFATAIPMLLRNRATSDPRQASTVDAELWSVCHQSSIYSATPAVIPFLLRLARCPEVATRSALIGLVAATAVGRDDPEALAAVHRALEQDIQLLVDLFADVSVAPFAVGLLPAHPPLAPRLIPEVRRLRERLADRPMVVAACDLALWSVGVETRLDGVLQLLRRLEEDDVVEAISEGPLNTYGRALAVEACHTLVLG